MKKWKRISTKIAANLPHFIVKEDLVILPNGEKKRWPYWFSNDSVMVLGMTSDKKLVMIRQYRYLVGRDVIEFPSGGLLENEKIENGARREFEEETGYKSGKLIKLGSFYETYGQLNRQIHIFFTKNISKTKQHLDRGAKGYEDIGVELIKYQETIELASKNKIDSMGSSLAALLLKEKIENKEIKI